MVTEQGLARQTNYLQAAHIAASTDLAVVLPTQLARYFAGLLPLQLFELPFQPGAQPRRALPALGGLRRSILNGHIAFYLAQRRRSDGV